MTYEEARLNEIPSVTKLLVDECLHVSLVDLARAAGHVADHVNYLGLRGFKDWKLIVTPSRHRELFQAALDHIEGSEPVNSVIEVDYRGAGIECREYSSPDG